MEKKAIRKAVLEVRRALAPAQRAEASAIVVRAVQDSTLWRSRQTLLAYWPMPDELDVAPLVRSAFREEKRVLLPRCLAGGSTFEAVEIDDPDSQLVAGPFPHLFEPIRSLPAASTDVVKDALIIVPGVAFDRHGHRLGFGAGMYDRFLAAHPAAFRLGVALAVQIVDALPHAPHDIRMQAVVTEKEWFSTDPDSCCRSI